MDTTNHSMGALRSKDIRQWCEAYDKHELVEILVKLSTANQSFQSLMGHAFVNDTKWRKIRVSIDKNNNNNNNNMKNVNENDIRNFFESKGKITSFEMNKDQNYCIITFERYQEAQHIVSVGYHTLIGSNNNEITLSSCYAFENDELINYDNNNNNNTNNNMMSNTFNMNPNNSNNNNMIDENNCIGPLAQRRIFVSSLAYATTDDTLRNTFSQYGDLEECSVVKDKITHKSKGYGFVVFKTVQGASNALQIPEKFIDGRRTKCWLASEGTK